MHSSWEFGCEAIQPIHSAAAKLAIERLPNLPALLEDASNVLLLAFRQLIDRLNCHLKELDQQVREVERQIIAWHRNSALSRKLEKIPGIGPLAATALVASIADARSFKNGRQVSGSVGR